MEVIDGFPKKIGAQVSRGSGKRPQAAGALRATQITSRGWLNRNAERDTPLNWLLEQATEVVRAQHLGYIPNFPWGNFEHKMDCLISGIGLRISVERCALYWMTNLNHKFFKLEKKIWHPF